MAAVHAMPPWLADFLASEAARRDVEYLLVAERDKE